MPETNSDRCKYYIFGLMLLKELEAGNDDQPAVKNILSKLKKDTISEAKAFEWCQEMRNCPCNPGSNAIIRYDIYARNGWEREGDASPLENLLQISDDIEFKKAMLTDNGRFLVFPYCSRYSRETKLSVAIYDLFLDKKVVCSTPIGSFSEWCALAGEYFLVLTKNYGTCLMHTLKINYENLTVTKVKTISIKNQSDPTLNNGFHFTIIGDNQCIFVDQLNNKNFIVCGDRHFVESHIGHIQNDSNINILDDVKNLDIGPYHRNYEHGTNDRTYMYGERLLANKFQGFGFNFESYLLEFIEFDVESGKKDKRSVLCNLERYQDGWWFRKPIPITYCWVENYFYGMYFITSTYATLLMFDLDTFKWSELKIRTRTPESVFVDKNGTVTLQVGREDSFRAFYRFSLRKPDTLMNLTRLFALRESNLYGNEKYFNAVQNIGI